MEFLPSRFTSTTSRLFRIRRWWDAMACSMSSCSNISVTVNWLFLCRRSMMARRMGWAIARSVSVLLSKKSMSKWVFIVRNLIIGGVISCGVMYIFIFERKGKGFGDW